jgi:hypothetical protein
LKIIKDSETNEGRAKMERLTDSGRQYHSCDFMEDGIYIFINRLRKYEDTGLTPPEVQELKERDTAKGAQKAEEQPYFRKHFHSYICPVCHKKVESRWIFCGHCGQRLKQED